MTEQPPASPPGGYPLPAPGQAGGASGPPQVGDALALARQRLGIHPTAAYTSWIRRVGAAIIDQLLFMIVAAILGVTGGVIIAAAGGSSRLEGIVQSIVALAVLAFWIWNWGYRQGTTGATVGKSALKFKVLSGRDGQPIGIGSSIMRQFAHFFDSIIFGVGYLLPLFTAKRQTIADMLMNTVCVPIEHPQAPPPAYGASPPYGTPEQPYGAPPPAYASPHYNAPGPPYSTSPPAGYATAERPGTATAAAVIAFVMAALNIIASLISLDDGLYYYPLTAAVKAVLYISAFVGVLFAALFIWGGVAALKGRTSKILLWTAVVSVVLCVINIASSVSDYSPFLAVLCLGLAAVIVILVLQSSSKDFFRARRGTTIQRPL